MAMQAPAQNIQAATVAAFIVPVILHICAANNIVIPADVADSLPGVVVIIVAHIWDCILPEAKS